MTTSSASANEGGFDENDRVSMRGTNPSLTQTLINGHNVAAGDWFVLNQVRQVGRSVSYTLLPSELVDQIVVHKSSQASLVEGGVAGSVDILTRRPLDFKEDLTFSVSAGAVYAEQPDEIDPQFNGLFNWKNDDEHARRACCRCFSRSGTCAATASNCWVTRRSRRAGPSSRCRPNPDLVGVSYPALVGAALFEQERKRTGGLIDIQCRPTDDLDLDAQFFMSDLDAANYNRNYLLWNTHFIARGGRFPDPNVVGDAGVATQAPLPGYVVRNNTLVQADFAPVPGTFYGVYDQISRPDEKATANYGTLDAEYKATDALTLTGQIGTSKGHGETPTQDVSETLPGAGMGASWQLHGTNSGPDFALGATDNSTPFPNGTPVDFGWIFGAQLIDVEDKEDWAQIDADFAVDNGAWTDLKFGARYNEHSRDSKQGIAQGPTFCDPDNGITVCGTDTANYPTTFQHYPSDFNSFGGNIPTNIWFWSPAQLAAYNGPGFVQRDPIARAYYQYAVRGRGEEQRRVRPGGFQGRELGANMGLRYVQTKEDIDDVHADVGR